MSDSRLVLAGAEVPTPSGSGRADILVEDGRIAALGSFRFPPGARVLDCAGRIVLPGGVDAHVHLSMPCGGLTTCDDFRSGSEAALRGGTTALVDFVEPARGSSLLDALDARLAEAADARTELKLHMTVTEWSDAVGAQMAECAARGVDSFKIYTAYLDSIGLDDDEAFQVLRRARDLGARVLVHAEAGRAVEDLRSAFIASGRLAPAYHALSRPPECEAAAISRIAGMVARLGGPRTVIAHVSSELGLREILAAKEAGLPVYAETCPHYLAFDDGVYRGGARRAARFVMSPPLRSRSDAEFIWDRIADGGVDFISTDHCPFPGAAKDEASSDFSRIPNGVGGIAERVAYMLSEGHLRRGIPLSRMAEVLSSNAGRLHGFSGSRLEAGAKADLCVWRFVEPYAYAGSLGGSRCDYSIYEGLPFGAVPETVLVSGQEIAGDWNMLPRQGRGGSGR